MKTLYEIKKALGICSNGGIWDCDVCPYGDSDDGWECRSDLYEGAAAYIQQLENQLADACENVEQLSAELEQSQQVNAGLEIMLNSAQSAAETWKRKCDAAVEDLKGRCFSCANAKPHEKYQNLIVCPHIKTAVGGNGNRDCAHWKWRGVKDVE